MSSLELVQNDPSRRGDLVAFLNEAYADLRALRAVGVERPDYPEFTEAELAARDEAGAETFVLHRQGAIVSAASWLIHADRPWAVLDLIATHPLHRRRGHAASLLAWCEEWARSLGLEGLQTGPFVDSRYAPACGLFERCGFEVREPTRMNTTWEIDIEAWQPREPKLPEGWRVVSFQPGDEEAWVGLHRAVFESQATVQWFRGRFRDLPNFDPEGWLFVESAGRKVGMAGAIVWFHDEALTRPSGSLVEWVGVLPEERGKGLGEALMVSCLNYLKGRAVTPNCIVTQYFREAAVGVYRKLGYRFVRECRTYAKTLG